MPARILPALACVLLCAACARGEDERRAVVAHYVRVASALYEDTLADGTALQQAGDALVRAPSAQTLAAARAAWQRAHRRYSQTEALRFGHWIVDEWETRVNAWPVEEGLLDYVSSAAAPADNPLARANLVASDSMVAGQYTVDTKQVSTATLQALNGLLGIETNVATGYHAIEFYLWGQDLNGTGPGAGERPWTDYAADRRCTRGRARAPERECRKRGQILQAATQRLVLDLREMALHWGPAVGSYGSRLAAGDPDDALRRMLFALGSLALQEMSGERIQTALLTGASEEEQDCFSDDTHQSLFANTLGIEALFTGRYVRANGEKLEGPSLDTWLERAQPGPSAQLRASLAATRSALARIVDSAESGAARFDQLIAPGAGVSQDLLRNAIAALTALARAIEDTGAALGLAPLNPAAHR